MLRLPVVVFFVCFKSIECALNFNITEGNKNEMENSVYNDEIIDFEIGNTVADKLINSIKMVCCKTKNKKQQQQ